MSSVKIDALPAGLPLTGSELLVMEQLGTLKQTTTLAVSGLFTPVAGPPGPPGPAGPAGPAGPYPMVNFTRTNVNYNMVDADDVVLVDNSGGVVSVTLPDATVSTPKPRVVKSMGLGLAAVSVGIVGGNTLDGVGGGSYSVPNGKAVQVAMEPATGNWWIVGVY